MKLVPHEEFISIVRKKTLLLDTNVFIDAISHPVEFAKFFNLLKTNGVTLVTLEYVLIEFIKGSNTETRLNEKKAYIEEVIETYLPNISDLKDYIIDLIKKYKIVSKDLSITDLFLGATLYKYGKNICLLTKDVSDFPESIFDRISYITLLEPNNIRNYGVYTVLDK